MEDLWRMKTKNSSEISRDIFDDKSEYSDCDNPDFLMLQSMTIIFIARLPKDFLFFAFLIALLLSIEFRICIVEYFALEYGQTRQIQTK